MKPGSFPRLPRLSGARLAASLSPLAELATPALAVFFIFQVLSGILVAPLLSLFPVFVERHLGLSTVFSANIRVLSVCAGGVVALFGGALSDALGRKPAYLLAMTGVISSGLIFLLDSPPLMYPLALYSGLMFGLGAVAGLSYVMDAAPRHTLALATACYFMSGTLGNAVGSAFSGIAARELQGGYRIIGLTIVIGQVLLLLGAWLLVPSLPRPAARRGVEALGAGFGEMLRESRSWALLALRFLPTVYWGCATLLMPLLLFRLTGSEKPAGYYASASMVLSAVCQLVMGRIVDRFGPRVPVFAAITVVTVATLGQGLCAGSVPGLVAFGLLGAGGAWSLSVSMTTLVHQLGTEDNRAKLLGLTHVAWSAGFLAGTLMSGWLAREHGQGGAAFLVSAACCVVAIRCAVTVTNGLSRVAAES
ncbi:MAG: Major Facilitator Superfamily [Armatimonadetes bacterium]|jgi:AAHS family 3-hydroxyphenylpropionic acid transporter|nr:Major Facilitator Superfamily [Armatimonadota bacterium]